jgi:glycosyltransferase involved in cell wall biosynthesis
MERSVLLVGNFFPAVLGSEGVCADLARKLTDANWRVIVTSRHVARLPRIMEMVSTVFRKRTSFSVAQVDVYSGAAFCWAEVVCGALRLIRKPFVLTLHGGNLPAFGEQSPKRVRRLLRSAAAVTTPSRYLYDHMLQYRDDLQLLPNALDLRQYSFHVRSRPRARLLWLRAFHEIYNPSLCPRVLSLLGTEFPECCLAMVGPDKNDGSLETTVRTARELNVLARIDLAGPVEKAKVPACFSNEDIFLNTSNVDNTPISILEAMASGLCIVSTNVGGIPYLLEHGKNGLLVPPNDPEAMAQAVLSILHKPKLAESLSRNARNTAEQFDWSFIVPKWEALFNSILSGAVYT